MVPCPNTEGVARGFRFLLGTAVRIERAMLVRDFYFPDYVAAEDWIENGLG